MQPIELLKTINTLFPEVSVKDYEHISKGYENDILIVNGNTVFRFLRNPDRSYRKEIQLLDYLQLHSNVSIPKIAYRLSDFRVMGYEIIPGVELTNEILASFSYDARISLAKQLAEFFAMVHGSTFVPEVQSCNFPQYHKAKYSWERLQGFLKDETNPKILDFAENLREKWLNYQEETENIRLLHNDLFFKNIIVDPAQQKLSGIIDFSDTFYADLALDFVAPYFENPEFTEQIMDYYELATKQTIRRDHVRLFSETFALNELYFEDVHNKEIARKIVGV